MLQGEYGSGSLDAGYSGGQAAFAAAYGQAGYPANAAGPSGQDAYSANALYSQGFSAASQVGKQHATNLVNLATCLDTCAVSKEQHLC